MTRAPAQRSRLAATVLALIVGLVVAGCGGSSSSSSSRAAATSSTASTPVTTTITSTVSSSSTASTPTATATRGTACGPAQLRIGLSRRGGGGGLGHTEVVLLFTNVGSSSCSLTGYPGVAGLSANGTQVTQARRTRSGYLGGVAPGRPIPHVILLPGQSASAIVEGTDVPAGNATSCPTLTAMLVTAPNTRPSVRVAGAPADCSGLEVHPVVPGATGSQIG